MLALGTLLVTLQNSNDEEILAQHRNSSVSYSIVQMSDGELNAAIIGATVLTVEPGTVLLIDEPERHLHRSIIEPFLSALFAHREDCTFIISTHELALPVANPEARVLTVRSCEWDNDKVRAWDIDLLEPETDLPEELRLAVLDSRQKVLFVEGTQGSLDLPIYHALFPDLSVISKGSSTEVQRAVAGLRGTPELNYVEAYGLVDEDGRTQEDVDKLAEHGVFALDVHSSESLYWCSAAITAVAHRQAESLGRDPGEMKESAIRAALVALGEGGLAERMAARRCQLLLRDRIMSLIPTWNTIADNTLLEINLKVESPFLHELARFRDLLDAKEFEQLVARYPLRESKAFHAITGALEFRRQQLYQQTLIALVQVDTTLAQSLRHRIGPLATALSTQSTAQVDIGE